jgi:hypothetical protein
MGDSTSHPWGGGATDTTETHRVIVPSSFPKTFLATSSKQSSSSIREAANAMTCGVDTPTDARRILTNFSDQTLHRPDLTLTELELFSAPTIDRFETRRPTNIGFEKIGSSVG